MGLVLALAACTATVSADEARVSAPLLDVFLEPSGAAYTTGQLHRGEVITVLSAGPAGWLAIKPPDGESLWIEDSALLRLENGLASVRLAGVTVRSGRVDARLPGPPNTQLSQGDVVRLLDLPSKRLRQGRNIREWVAIAPPEGLVRYVRADGVAWQPPAGPTARLVGQRAPVPELDVAPLLDVGPGPPSGSLGPDEAAEFRRLDAAHRAVLRASIEYWRLDHVRAGYTALLASAANPAARAALQRRLDLLHYQEEAAAAARRVGAALRRSRELDGALPSEAPPVDAVPQNVPYDKVGFLQESSRLVNGGKVYALIGPEGRASAYLRVPTGTLVRRYLGRNVGVRGDRRYDPDLHAEIITVTELGPVD